MKKKILIVEDEQSLVKVLVEKFTIEDFVVFEAKDGVDGMLVAQKELPDIILLDIIMPKMDGVSMLRKLHNSDWGKDIPVIMLTNLSDNEKVAESMANGSYDYLVKSNWKIEDIVKIVKNKLGI